MMGFKSPLLGLLALFLPAKGSYHMPALRGICTGNTGAGVGCGFDGTQTTAFGMSVAPKKAVLQLEWCPEHCYASCPPSYPIPYECEDCVYTDAHGGCFRAPSNVQATAAPNQGGCYETNVAGNTASYQKLIDKTQSHSSFFHSSSKTTKKFYSYYFQKNYSMALSYKYVLEHSVTVVPTFRNTYAPTREFRLAALLLPKEYDMASYRQFIDTFGTHYMSQAFMGGSVLLTNYFHSCFLNTYSNESVTKASSSSFFNIYNENSAHGWGSSINKTLWDTWSDIDLKLNGGNASAYGTLGVDNKMSPADVANWQSSLDATNMVPLTYTLAPVTDLLSSDWIDPSIAKNVNKALADYDAEVGVEMQQLQDYLVSKDNYTTPSWCKIPPDTPPSGGGGGGGGRRRRRRRKIRTGNTQNKRKMTSSLPGCPALPPVPPLESALTKVPSKRGLRAAESVRGAPASLSTPPTTYGPIPGLVSASGELGSLLDVGTIPWRANQKVPSVSGTTTGGRARVTPPSAPSMTSRR
jgi:hypothetical protein